MTVKGAFELAEFPIPDVVIGFGSCPFFYNRWFGRVSMDSTTEYAGQGFCFCDELKRWVFYGGEPGYLFEPSINIANLPAKDAWEQLPKIVREHPAVVAAMGTTIGIKDAKDTTNYMIATPNKPCKFRCECGCNVFRKTKPYDGMDVFQCNACEAEYSGKYTNSGTEKDK